MPRSYARGARVRPYIGGQDDEIGRLVRALGSRGIVERDRASTALIRMGPAVIPKLRLLLEGRVGEVRARMQEVIEEIQRRERLADFDAGPTLVTLRSKRRTLEDIFKEIRGKVRTEINLNSIPSSERIDIELTDVPLLEAVDRICRAHGRLRYDIYSSGAKGSITIRSSGAYVDYPRVFGGPFALWIRSMQFQEENDLKGGAKSTGSLSFQAAWETGTRPTGLRLQIEELLDGQGRSQLHLLQGRSVDYYWGYAPTNFSLRFSQAPPRDVRIFSRIRGTLTMSVPTDVGVVAIPFASLRAGYRAGGAALSLEALSVRREEKELYVEVAARFPSQGKDPQIVLWRNNGRKVSAYSTSRSTTYEAGLRKTIFRLRFRVQRGEEVDRLEASTLVGTRIYALPFEFKDVRIRPPD